MSSLLRLAQAMIDRIASLEPATPLEIESSDDLNLTAASGKDINYVTTGGGVHRFEGETVHADAVTFGEAQMPTPAGNAPVFACRAWVRFNGDSVDANNHCAIYGSGNVDYVHRTGTGNYTIYFLTDMPDANCAVVASSTALSLASWDGTMSVKEVHANRVRVQGQGNITSSGLNWVGSNRNSQHDNVSVAVFR
jgi:hypothetical protein